MTRNDTSNITGASSLYDRLARPLAVDAAVVPQVLASERSETLNPETLQPETLNPETLNPETLNPETLAPEGLR